LFLPEVGDWLSGKPATEAVISEAAQMAKELARPISDLRGTIPQRKHLSEVLSKRALQQAVIRAREVL
jgi:CO/xanthine dehydrogenase FAD-binding subunit